MLYTHFTPKQSSLAISMASSLTLKRFLSSALLSKSLLRPVASSASRSFNTNAVSQYDDERNVDVDRRSDRSFPHIRRDDLFSGNVFDTFSPTRSLSQVLNMMDQLTDNPFLSASRGIGAGGVRRGWDAKETEDALLLRLDMPGLGKEDVKISVEQNTLTIKGKSAKESDEEEESVRRFSSRIDLPEKLYKIDNIKAEMKNGVLKVTVPKIKEEERNDVINVNVE
ncbi:heat shock 22 kDa protein, mitochondrial isoform X1 [Cicer arietinum]|uniref:Heat shock 22 kDa protein, mitochondrial isoform X1 n=1 Tax=Cicer arietinum TaxID=3827 RepID=A0A1S2YKY0_CICAR|nr:heat shock 22 kDa protein, mitochondrial isoform X1 [Cicer arietinum]